MAFTARTLITYAYYLSGVVSKKLQTVDGEQINKGLFLLNVLLSDKSTDKKLLPYYSEYDFTAVIGQETYFVPNLVDVETITFNMQTLRVATYGQTRRAYRGSTRIDGLNSLPLEWTFERCPGGGNISFYFIPNSAYPIKVWGKFSLTNVTLDQDLSVNLTNQTGYDAWYLDYLRHELAAYICNDYNIPLQPQVAETLEALRNKDIDVSPPDLSMIRRRLFRNRNTGWTWYDVNITRGWRPDINY